MLLLIDNYDSFTHNLARYFCELDQDVVVKRNDQISIEDVKRLAPKYLVLSPGPCTPNESGICLDVIREFAGDIPILGVCLGHQAIGQVFGAQVRRASKVMHGKTSLVRHTSSALFADTPETFSVTRYHSLVLERRSIPQEFDVTAVSLGENEVEEVMAIEHKTKAICGVQFHPESVMTEYGHQVLDNFLRNYA